MENFDPMIAYDVVTLPSQGIHYENKKKSLKVAYLTAADENILTSPNLVQNDMVVEELLRRKILDKDVDIDSLAEEDRQAILLFLRNTAFGPEYSVRLEDPKTGKLFEKTLVLDELKITQPDNKPTDEGTFSVELPKTGSKVKLKPLSFGEILEIDRIIENYPQGRVAPKVTLKLQRQIVEINGSQDKGEIAKFIEQMPIMDSKFIRKFMDDNEPRLNMNRVVTTPSGDRLTVNVGFGVEFFRPFF